ncbi:MAG: hypothetical protein HOP33_20560 [Verrucomicrobia bacterium]|nr:hypothetical protein [Verrucomicrobiota bacterium]
MKRPSRVIVATCIAGLLAGGAITMRLQAEDKKENAIEKVMKTCHKAPKGEDPICKKAGDGKATTEEIKKLVAGYKVLTTAKPPKGDAASWKEKTGKLLAAAESLEKGEADATKKYKEAVNCKACHSAHKPD